MKLRLAWVASAWLVWTGCGGAFTTPIDSDTDAGTGTGTTSGGTTGTGGSTGEGGSSSGTAGSSSGTAGSSSGTGGSVGSGSGGATTGSGGASGTGGSVGGTGGGATGGSTGAGGNRGPDWAACDGPGQCVAVESPMSCCPTCGSGDLTRYVGVNVKHVQELHQMYCPNPVVCPAIACTAPMNQNIGARCVMGACQVFDVRNVPEFSACSVDNACHLRSGLGCCECGTGTNNSWVAVSTTGMAAITAAECAPNAACPDCVAVPPPKTLASCSNHVCQVLLAP